ncbi:MAG: recombinase, partial [Sphingobacteriales bacterium]
FETEKGETYESRYAQAVLKETKQKQGSIKRSSIHLIRHNYATHLLEGGTAIRYLQAFLGHNPLQTTMRYTHVSKLQLESIQSPLDKLSW